MPLVDIEGVGQVEFPDDVTDDELIRESTRLTKRAGLEEGRKTAAKIGEQTEKLANALSWGEFLVNPFASTQQSPFGLATAAAKPVGAALNEAGNVAAGAVRDIGQGAITTGAYPATGAALGGADIGPAPGNVVGKGIEAAARMVPTVAAGVAGSAVGLPVPVAFGAPMFASTLEATGDPGQAVEAGLLGAAVPGVAGAGREAAAGLIAKAVNAGIRTGGNIPEKIVESIAAQGGLQLIMEGMHLPEYLAMKPEQRKEALLQNLVANSAFMMLELPGIAKGTEPSMARGEYNLAAHVGDIIEKIANSKEAVTELTKAADDYANQATLPTTTPEGFQIGTPGPMPLTRSTLAGLSGLGAHAVDTIRSMAGVSMPRTTRADREAGELGVRYASSRIAAPYVARSFVKDVLGGLDVDPGEFGAALSEDNFRSIRADFLASGDNDSARAVTSLIGAKNSPFQTEKAYQDYLSSPSVMEAVQRHIIAWDQIIEPMYKQAAGIDPSAPLATRGAQTGARISLYGLKPGEDLPGAVTVFSSQPNLRATIKRKSSFARRASGASDHYVLDYEQIMANKIGRDLEIANKNAYEQRLIQNGDAVVARSGAGPRELKGEAVEHYPHRSITIAADTAEGPKTIAMPQDIYIRKSLAHEYIGAANPMKNLFTGNALSRMTGAFNQAALAGLTDATVHLSNLATVLFTRPRTGARNPVADILLSSLGRADIPVALTRAVTRGFQNNTKQLAELAEIGALRPELKTRNPLGKLIGWADKTVRVVMDDTFTAMAKEGLVEDTETNRREFVNQVGQYNTRLQGFITRTLRQSGFSPFITAGKTFNALGMRNLTLNPGVKANTASGAAMLKASILAKWVGSIALIGAVNYILTKDNGGGVMGRPGTPIGRIDSGKNYKNGAPLTLPALDLIGFGRGLRATGIRGFAESKLLGLNNATARDAASKDMINTWLSPIAGPPVSFLMGTFTGYPVAVDVGRKFPVVPPGQGQHLSDLANALYEANPVVATTRELGLLPNALPYANQLPPKEWTEAAGRQLPRLTLTPGRSPENLERYPELVQRSQANNYLDDVFRRARRMGLQERIDYVTSAIGKMPPVEQGRAWQEAKKRRVFVAPGAEK